MYILTLSEAAELKNTIKNRFDTKIHFHDGCGGQYFSVDKNSVEINNFITDYFASKKLKVIFSENGMQFSLERIL